MSEGALPKAYSFHEVESRCYAYWEQLNCFHADANSNNPPFSIVIPPPNVTGRLHMGHALNNTLQDILIRYKLLKGHAVLWMPGTDHAGIATQNVVERQLAEQNLTRHDVGREAFLERVWQWKDEFGGIIVDQLKRLGAACDWERLRFTMDEGLSKAVRKVFVSLCQEGLIYRGKAMINWCPRCMTALANIEVEGEEVDSRLYHIRYPLVSGEGALVVATTRPETMLGDTAVAVHPEDPRYTSCIGQKAILPLMGRAIPVIGDTYVDREFGTGALKITPGHDFNDFQIGRSHGLELVQVIGEDGTMTEAAGPYAGLDRYACRKKVLEDLERDGYLDKIENYHTRIGHCYRCMSVVEPLQSLQWFVAVRTLAERAMAAVREGSTRILPERWEKDYFNWMENIEDWCVSRQIWWGHRIPAWYCRDCSETIIAEDTPTACTACGGSRLEQDPDVLDTWFSSALWPFSTMGWPDKTPELDKFYPTSVLVTAFDILFFWVARMMMMGLHFMGEVPFREVCVHALVRDGEGQKMSKSRGNVIDPLEMMDRYGTDALRFTLTALAAQGRDIKLSEERIEGYRHFVNKLWNAARLVLMNLDDEVPPGGFPEKPEKLMHRWILSRLQRIIMEIEEAVDNYHFNRHAHTLYQFLWHEYCDWYLEMIKADIYGDDPEARVLAQRISAGVLERVLILLHPIMPFVTEEIWQKMPQVSGSILQATFPETNRELLDLEAEADMQVLMEVVTGIRNIRGEMNVPPAARVEAVCLCDGDAPMGLLQSQRSTIIDLARLSSLQVEPVGAAVRPRLAASAVAVGIEMFVVLKDVLDFDGEARRLQKELAKLDRELQITQKKLMNEDFLNKAPIDVIEREREKGARLSEKWEKLKSRHERINALRESTDSGS